ncbi:MAG TPA: hypothetical protein VH879_14620 [Gemmatimonadales bacterium]
MRRLTRCRALRLGGWAAILTLVLQLSGPRALPAQTQSPEAVLVELAIGRIASRTVPAYRAGEQALIPLSTFFELSEVRATRRPDGALEAIVQPANVALVVEPASHTVRLGKEKLPVTPDQLLVTDDGDLYLSTTLLGRVLRLDIEVSWSELQVVVLEPEGLPIARRLRREAMLRAQLPRSSQDQYPGLRLGLERPGIDGLIFDYSVLTPTTGVSGTAYSTMLGLDVLGGSLALGLQSQNGAGRAPRAETSWTGIWRENRWFSQLRLGDGFATGPRGRNLRGFSASNSPYVRPATIGNMPFTGQLGAGWTVEAYRGGRLIGFDSVNALGQFSFDVPIQYGENPVDFVAYGPFGEVREFNQTYRAAVDGLPAHRFEYGVAAGECRTPLCTTTGNLDLRYGLSNRWTMRAGLDQFWRDSLANLTHPYIGVTGGLTNSLLLDGEAVGDAVLRGALRFEPSVNLQLQAEANRFASGVRAPILTPAGRQSQWTLSAFLRPVSRLAGTYLEASMDRINAGSVDLTSARFGGSIQASDIRLLPSVRFQRQTGAGPLMSQTFWGLNTFVLPRPSLGKVLGSMTARTTLEFESGVGASSASAYLGIPLLRGLRSEAGVTWFRSGQGPGFSLLIAAELPSVRSYTTVTAGGGLPATGSQYVTGSAIYDPSRHGVDFSGSSALQRGGVTGRVFLDSNGNGQLDEGERTLAGVRVIVGPSFGFSDSTGNYRVWDVLPYEPTAVAVDSASLASPLWVPAFAGAMVEPSPNRFRQLDIPILPGGVIEGSIRWKAAAGDASRGLPAGVTLVLRHRQSHEQRLITTFTDGTFYAIGVRPGEWEMRVDPRCLDALGATADVVRFTMLPDAEGATVSGLDILLQ